MSERLTRDECTCAGALIETNAHEAHCAVYGTARDGLRWTDGQTSLAARLADQAARLAKVEALCDEADEVPPLHSMIPRGCVRVSEVRAALHPDPSEANRVRDFTRPDPSEVAATVKANIARRKRRDALHPTPSDPA
jgi:FAD/FMN-containing dehydrogenase